MKNIILSLGISALAMGPLFSAEKSNSDFIVEAKESSIEMLIKATKMLDEGKISKDKYIEVAREVSKMAEYSNKSTSTGPKSITEEQLKKLNEERVQNGLKPIVGASLVDGIIQSELDQRVEINGQRLKEKKSPLPAMPIMEKLGAMNLDREERRQTSIKASLNADSTANEVAGRKSGILEIYKSYNKKIDDKKLDELTKSSKSLSEIIKEVNQDH
ncbi:MAG: hypothetical protein H7281_17970 [Bacteriovorax sp.]|nr:hypothetical protein [Bacteriovorax sp.]